MNTSHSSFFQKQYLCSKPEHIKINKMQVYYLKILENASIIFENINTIAIRLNDILYIAVHLDNDLYFLLIF